MSFTGKPAATTLITITNNGFWPDLVLGDFLKNYRIPPEYGDDTIAYGVKQALLAVNQQLTGVKAAIIVAGYITLEYYTDANDDLVDDEPVLAFLYKQAVFSNAKAFLLQQFNSMNRRKDAENAVKESPETYQFWMDESQKAVFQLVKKFLPDENITANSGVYVALI